VITVCADNSIYLTNPILTWTKATNDEGGDMNVAFDHDHDTSQSDKDTIPGVAKRFKARGQPWGLVVDENYGEGSAREHAALQPRFYGTYPRGLGGPLLIPLRRVCDDCSSIFRTDS